MMRRDLLLGGACLAALGCAEWLRPRRVIQLMTSPKLADIVPVGFGTWSSEADGELIVPKTPGSLADRLYSDTVTRRYIDAGNGAEIMLLIAYGGAQSDSLQLHRPEACYPAVGFEITRRKLEMVNIAGAAVPAVFLTAEAAGRREDILYWTRIGEFLPRSAGEQRSDRLKAAMEGYVGDGVLVRMSMINNAGRDTLPLLTSFATNLMAAVKQPSRKAFVGTARADQIATKLSA